MYPFSYTGLHLLHDKQVYEAMERARVDAELARNSRNTARLSLLSRLLTRIHSWLRVFAHHRTRVTPSRLP